jgi:U4/U6.U5 tri-snRNP-associated protein 1
MEVDNSSVVVKLKANDTSGKPDDRPAKFDAIMAKGNERTQQAFSTRTKQPEKDMLDEEPDDSFLNAALAKARRLNRLRELNKVPKGADAVAEAVKVSAAKDQAMISQNGSSSGGISFTIDDTREFTLALQARAQQKEREAEKGKQPRANAKANQIVKIDVETSARDKDKMAEVVVETAEDEDVDMEELAKEVKTDDLEETAFEGSTARSAGVGRGLSSFVSMLKTTGEISDKNAKEELKGRAKDERHYENYAPVDLSKVVKIGRNATDKDRELANREIKLEYRDKHGRLLTTKEAYRDLCYQFHGHGGSKKKEEKRLKQIGREQAQTRMASQQVAAARDGSTASTLGALKATQKATGKAFIVHKT